MGELSNGSQAVRIGVLQHPVGLALARHLWAAIICNPKGADWDTQTTISQILVVLYQ